MNTVCKAIKKPVQRTIKRVAKPAKKLTIAQIRERGRVFKYLSIWEDIFKKWGWENKSDAEKSDLRHEINEDLFGKYIAPSKLSNEQFTIMRFAIEILNNDGILVWSKEMAAVAVEEGLRRIYTWWIDNAGLDIDGVVEYGAPEEYIAAIARDRFHGVADWRTLNSKELWQLFITIKNRVRKAQQKGVSLWQKNQPAEESDDCPF